MNVSRTTVIVMALNLLAKEQGVEYEPVEPGTKNAE